MRQTKAMKLPGGSKLHRVCLASALFVTSLHGGAAASLRATPAKAPADTAAKTVAKASTDTQQAAPAVSDEVAATIENVLKLNATVSAGKQKVAETSGQQPSQHKKLDVGFSAYESTLMEKVTTRLNEAASGPEWNDDLRSKFTKNVTEALKANLKTILQPVKQSIGKTWMALPQDSQKDEYVDTLKKSFADNFNSSMHTVETHLDLCLKRVKGHANEKLSANELLEKSEFSVADSLITEHCYEVDAKKSLKATTKTNTSEAPEAKKKFCIQSVLGALVHRLNDTQGLISMSMRFDAGAMSLAQKGHKAPKASH